MHSASQLWSEEQWITLYDFLRDDVAYGAIVGSFPTSSIAQDDFGGLFCAGRVLPPSILPPPPPPIARQYGDPLSSLSADGSRVCVSMFGRNSRDGQREVERWFMRLINDLFILVASTLVLPGPPCGGTRKFGLMCAETMADIYSSTRPNGVLDRAAGVISSSLMDVIGVLCATGDFAHPESWTLNPEGVVPFPVHASACHTGVAVVNCPVNANGIRGLPASYMGGEQICPISANRQRHRGSRDTEIFAFASPEECRAAVANPSSVPLAMHAESDNFGAYARAGGVSTFLEKSGYGMDMRLSSDVPIKRSNFGGRLLLMRDTLSRAFDDVFYPQYIFHYHWWWFTRGHPLYLRSEVWARYMEIVDEAFDRLAMDILLPRLDLRTLDGSQCSSNFQSSRNNFAALFGESSPECYINAQVAMAHEKLTHCFPAGAQLLTESGRVVLIEEVQLGDVVQIIDRTGGSSFAVVHTISHADASQAVEFCYATAGGRNVTAECANYLPTIEGNASSPSYISSRLKTMRDLAVGDMLFTAVDGAATVSSAVVSEVGTVVLQGLYHIHANVGTATLVVDGFVVSELVDLDSTTGNPSAATDGMGTIERVVTMLQAEARHVHNVSGNASVTMESGPTASSAQEGLTSAIEVRSGATPTGIGANVTTVLTLRSQMGLLRLSHLMHSSLGAERKSQADAKLLRSNWFFGAASREDLEHLYLLGESFAATTDDPTTIHLTAQPPLTTSGLTSTLGSTSIYHMLMFLFEAGDFFSSANDMDWSLTGIMNRTGVLAVLSSGDANVTVGEVEVTAPTGVGVPDIAPLPSPSPAASASASFPVVVVILGIVACIAVVLVVVILRRRHSKQYKVGVKPAAA